MTLKAMSPEGQAALVTEKLTGELPAGTRVMFTHKYKGDDAVEHGRGTVIKRYDVLSDGLAYVVLMDTGIEYPTWRKHLQVL